MSSTHEPRTGGSPAPDPHAPPPVTDEMRARARDSPGGWLTLDDPQAVELPEPWPPWVSTGAYRIDERGALAEWSPNERYLPSPATLGWPEPTDPLDAALQLVATRWVSDELMFRALATCYVHLARTDGVVGVVDLGDGRTALEVYSTPERVTRAEPDATPQRTALPAVLPLAREAPTGDDTLLVFNPQEPWRAAVPVRVITDAVSTPWLADRARRGAAEAV